MRSSRRKSSGGGGGKTGWDVRPGALHSPSEMSTWQNPGRRNPRPSPPLQRDRYDDLYAPADVSRRRNRSPPDDVVVAGSGGFYGGGYHPSDALLPAIARRERVERAVAVEDLPRRVTVPVNGDERGGLPLNPSYIGPAYEEYRGLAGLPRDELARTADYGGFGGEPPQLVPVRGAGHVIVDDPRSRRVSEYDQRRQVDVIGDDVLYPGELYPPARRVVGDVAGELRNLEQRRYLEAGGALGAYPVRGDEVLLPDRDFRLRREDFSEYRDSGRGNLSPPGMVVMDMNNFDNGGVGPVRGRVMDNDLTVLRETRNARAIGIEDEGEMWIEGRRMVRAVSPVRRPAGFDYSRLRGLSPRMPDSGLIRDGDLKRRLRPASPDWYSSNRGPNYNDDYYDDRRVRLVRRKGIDGQPVGDMEERDQTDPPKIDPKEDSEEFKQQVQKAFLRFWKLLHEDPSQRKKYLGGGNDSGSFLCSICDRQPKGFGDVYRLVEHTFHSLKPGLRTEHRGLHKALCLLMGWDWTIPPDASKRYVKPGPDAKALKNDLIVWPPVIIIRDLSEMKKPVRGVEPNTAAIEAALKEMKVDLGKAKISRGRARDGSTALVKFKPTLSGLKEADKLHRLLCQRKKGRKELEKASGKKASEGEAVVLEGLGCLYGYMGTVEDLDMLDSEMKRRCSIKSKKEIEGMVDAPIEAIKSE